ncbi:MAG: translation initiation factor IF-3 [candidate division Zixibacteria bacterium]|nr:translation initiation factor IF-3 [candidate division Zixibacteria bacterium]
MRINTRIRSSQVRLIGPDGQQVGVVSVKEAQQMAYDRGLDLVEVSPTAKPPVCRILDYGKYKYDLSKKEKIARKKQHTVQLKAMRYRPKIEEHDFQFKTKHVRQFLLDGFKVKVYVEFRGREMAHTEFGKKVLDKVQEELSDISTVEQKPKMEGRRLGVILMPK